MNSLMATTQRHAFAAHSAKRMCSRSPSSVAMYLRAAPACAGPRPGSHAAPGRIFGRAARPAGLIPGSGTSGPHPHPHLAGRRAFSHSPVTAQASASKYQAEIDQGIEAVKLACALCQKVQASLAADETETKGDTSPVTVADYGAQALVSWALQRASPDAPISLVAEEDSESLRGDVDPAPLLRARITELVNEVIAGSGGASLTEEEVLEAIDRGASPGGDKGRHWVLDPIDGTRGFVGGRQYAVCLGMLDGGEPVLGVLGCPNLPQASLAAAPADVLDSGAVALAAREDVGVIFSAGKGGGAWVQPVASGPEARQPIRVDDVTDPAGARFMESYESRHSAHGVSAAAAAALGITAPPLRLDSQTKYGALARGDASMYMRFPPEGYREKIWDHAAGAVVITEAGGVVTDASGAPLDFGKGRWLDIDRGIIAANPALHPQLLDAVNL